VQFSAQINRALNKGNAVMGKAGEIAIARYKHNNSFVNTGLTITLVSHLWFIVGEVNGAHRR